MAVPNVGPRHAWGKRLLAPRPKRPVLVVQHQQVEARRGQRAVFAFKVGAVKVFQRLGAEAVGRRLRNGSLRRQERTAQREDQAAQKSEGGERDARHRASEGTGNGAVNAIGRAQTCGWWQTSLPSRAECTRRSEGGAPPLGTGARWRPRDRCGGALPAGRARRRREPGRLVER